MQLEAQLGLTLFERSRQRRQTDGRRSLFLIGVFLRRQPRQYVLQIRVQIMPVGLGRLDQAHQRGRPFSLSGWLSHLAQLHDVTARSPLRHFEGRSICSGMGRMVNESFRSCSR